MMIQEYVLAFAFNKDLSKVLLIEKLKPEWQKGRLNGIGGKMNILEHENNAMQREFEEESGIFVKHNNWIYLLNIRNNEFAVHCFTIILSNEEFNSAKSMEAEQIKKIDIKDVFTLNTITNVKWLIPLALERLKGLNYHININNDHLHL